MKKKSSLPADRQFTEKEIATWSKRARPIEQVKNVRKGAVIAIDTPYSTNHVSAHPMKTADGRCPIEGDFCFETQCDDGCRL